MLQDYEAWFHDVTQDWNHLDPQRIHLGTERQPRTTLSQFDWSGPGTIGGNFGHWKVHTRAGTYRLRLRFDAATTDGRAVVRYGDTTERRTVPAGDSTALFEGVGLPERDGTLEAFVERGRAHEGVRFVDVERLD
jgi:hypothetical protein